MVELATRVVVVGFALLVVVVFSRLAWRVRQAPVNGVSNREPLLWSVAWFGGVIAVMWLILPSLPYEMARLVSRVGIITAALPPCHQVWRLHRGWW